MASSSVLSRLIICRRGLVAGSRKLISGTRFCISNSGHDMSTMAGSEPPWLMQPPSFEGTMSTYKAYNLKNKKLITFSGQESSPMVPNSCNLFLKGSSHGWLALYNSGNLDLFLYNPLSRRHIMLPDVRTLPNINKDNLKAGRYGCIAKVIVSCSPDNEEECRAMITYNASEALAFCWPGRSKEWTPIGDLYCWDESGKKCARGYTDFVYSDKQKAFICYSYEDEFETWDLRDPLLPRMIPMKRKCYDDDDDDDDDMEQFTYETKEEENLRLFCRWEERIVVTPDDDLLFLTRYPIDHVGPDGSYVDFIDKGSEGFSDLTVDFSIQKYHPEDGEFKRVDGSGLGGLAIFVGRYSHSVALSTTEFPELMPNSIYFTDSFAEGSWNPEVGVCRHFGGYDIGIFNFENKTVSPCYYPCDIQSIKRIALSPFWFFPN